MTPRHVLLLLIALAALAFDACAWTMRPAASPLLSAGLLEFPGLLAWEWMPLAAAQLGLIVLYGRQLSVLGSKASLSLLVVVCVALVGGLASHGPMAALMLALIAIAQWVCDAILGRRTAWQRPSFLVADALAGTTVCAIVMAAFRRVSEASPADAFAIGCFGISMLGATVGACLLVAAVRYPPTAKRGTETTRLGVEDLFILAFFALLACLYVRMLASLRWTPLELGFIVRYLGWILLGALVLRVAESAAVRRHRLPHRSVS